MIKPVFAMSPLGQLCGLLAIAFLLGGGGIEHALFNLVIQAVAFALLAINLDYLDDRIRVVPRALFWLLGLSIALPLVQSLPLPHGIWSMLPGRDVEQASLDLVGRANAWMPWSVDFTRTLTAAASLVPVLTVVNLSSRLSPNHAVKAVWFVVALGLITLLFGMSQLTEMQGSSQFYYGRYYQILRGTFANRNTAALLLVICVNLVWVAPFPLQARAVAVIRTVLAALLGVGVMLTQSRSATALLAMSLAYWGFVWVVVEVRANRSNRTRRLSLAVVALMCCAISGMGLLASGSTLDRIVARFGGMQDVRFQIWEDSQQTVLRYWPVGAGVGAFDQVFALDESLEHVATTRANRAHSEILETSVESGLVGLALMLAWLIWFARNAGRPLLTGQPPLKAAAAMSLLAVMLQSLVDFPLRNQAMLCIAAFLLTLVGTRVGEVVRGEPTNPKKGASVFASQSGHEGREIRYKEKTGRK